MKMGLDLDGINKEIDFELIRLLTLLQDYTSLTLETEVCLRNGWNDLAKARYLKGSHYAKSSSFPSLDSDHEFQAPLTVIRESNRHSDLDPQDVPRSLVSSYTDPKVEAQELIRTLGGILPPQPLKTAYSSFRSTIEKTIERLNTAEQIQSSQEKLKDLRLVKKSLISSTAEENISPLLSNLTITKDPEESLSTNE